MLNKFKRLIAALAIAALPLSAFAVIGTPPGTGPQLVDGAWLNGLAGGYTRGLKNGVLTDAAEDGPYKVLIEGLESFAGLTDAGSLFDEESDMHFATTAQGHRYLSAKR